MNYKIYIVLFVLFLIIRSGPFVSILSKIDGTVKSSGDLTSYGVVLQGIFLVILFIGIEALVNNNYL